MARMTKSQFEELFREEVLPSVAARYERDGVPDKPARREAWNDTVDAYIRDRALPESAGDWAHPRWLETWRPQGGTHHAAKKQKHLHFAGYDFTAGPEGTVVHRPSPAVPAFRAGDRVEYRDVNLWQQGTVTGADGKWITVRWDGKSFESREWAPNLRHASTSAAHAAKKSPAQLQREIDEVLNGGRSAGSRRAPKSSHATIGDAAAKSKRVPKTQLLWVVQGNYGYGHGWEDLTAADNWKEAKGYLRDYRENERGVPFRVIRRREKINP